MSGSLSRGSSCKGSLLQLLAQKCSKAVPSPPTVSAAQACREFFRNPADGIAAFQLKGQECSKGSFQFQSAEVTSSHRAIKYRRHFCYPCGLDAWTDR